MDHELSESHHDDELKGDFLPPSRDEGEKQGEAFVPLSQEESEKHAETSLPFHVDESDIHAEETFHLESRGERKPLLPKEFLDEIDRLESSEEKLERVVAFMQEALGGSGGHQVREFWEARRLCLGLFQTVIHPTVRVRIWARYSELCKEARRLKELFEEQSSFVTEQIEMAIQAIEEEFAGLETKLSAMGDIEAFQTCTSIHHNLDQYHALQHELDYLNAFASRISSLRKEAFKTEIRHKQKTRLLERLWTLGNSVYPRRKLAIRNVSALFLSDVDGFIQKTFVGELKMHELFEAREEIKRLQNVGKLLTLSTEVFTKTRLQLSECWDSIKTVLKERKLAQAEQRESLRHHRDDIIADLEAVKTGVEAGTLTLLDGQRNLRQINSHMHTLSLAHQDVRPIREKWQEVEAFMEQKKETERKQAPPVPQRKEIKHQEVKHLVPELLVRAQKLMEPPLLLERLDEGLRSLIHEAVGAGMSKSDRLALDRTLSSIRGLIENLRAERIRSSLKEEEIIEELSALEQMRAEIKRQLEVWRKVGGSSCDFSEALQYTECVEEERARLERIDALIESFEERSHVQEET